MHSLPLPLRGLTVIASVILALSCVELRSQIPPLDEASSGTTYVVAFPDTAWNLMDTLLVPPVRGTRSLHIYSSVPNFVSISGPGYSRTLTLQPGKFAVVQLNDTNRTGGERTIVTTSGSVSGNTFRIEAEKPILLYCFMLTSAGAEGWTPIPVERWGMEYFAAAVPGESLVDMRRKDEYRYVPSGRMGPAEILVIAAYDDTEVSIYPTGRLAGDVPTTVQLRAGQAYQVQGWVDTVREQSGDPQPDLGGTLIRSNKPIGVISGNTRAQIVFDIPEITGNSLKNMLIEWLPPIDAFGREFVSLPTWDTRRLTGEPGEKVAEKRSSEYIRIYGAESGTLYQHIFDSLGHDSGRVDQSWVEELRVAAPKPHYIRTSKPAQAMMHSSAVVKNTGPISGTPGSQSFQSWGAYMTELVPREQWTSLAPYYAPTYLGDMRHYLAVVADSGSYDKIYWDDGSPFDFNQGNIHRTGFIWGTTPVTAGEMRYLRGIRGARFYAVLYGLYQGMESYIPEVVGAIPAEYREVIGFAYGMPLAPRRQIFRPADILQVDTVATPCALRVRIRAVNPDPVGLLSVALDESSTNAKVVVSDPSGWKDVAGLAAAEVQVMPVDPLLDAHGSLVITDRTGNRTTVPYSYVGDRVEFDPGRRIDFGEIMSGSAKDTVIEIVNPLTHFVTIQNILLRFGNQSFRITGGLPSLPAVLQPGEKLRLSVRATPSNDRTFYRDTVIVQLRCGSVRLGMQVGQVPPCLTVNDLDFGVVDVNREKTLTLQLCNEGHGYVTFGDVTGLKVLTWLSANFTVKHADLQRLRLAALGIDQCISIPVTFRGSEEQTYETVAQIWASTRECRDTSIWHAVVRLGVSSDVEERKHARAGDAAITAMPNPFNGRTRFTFRIDRAGPARLAVHDAAGEELAMLHDAPIEAGLYSIDWDAPGLPSGIYYGRLTAGGIVRSVAVMVVR